MRRLTRIHIVTHLNKFFSFFPTLNLLTEDLEHQTGTTWTDLRLIFTAFFSLSFR